MKLFKTYLRSISSRGETSNSITDPFLRLQIECPRGVYDVNIEPGKDDVVFEDRDVVISLAESLFRDCYGQLPVDTKKSPAKGKSASSVTAGIDSGFNLLMARKEPEIAVPLAQSNEAREFLVTRNDPKPLSRPSFRPHAAISPETHLRRDSQFENVDQNINSGNRDSPFINPWSITKMNTPLQTPGRHGRNSDGRTSLSPDLQRSLLESRRTASVSRQTPRSPPETPDVASHETARAESGSPISRRQLAQDSNTPFSSTSPIVSNSRRAARERDRERYGNGALDTWFQRTTQISMGQTPLDQPAGIDEIVPTLSQLSQQRFGADSTQRTTESGPREPSEEILNGTPDDVEPRFSPQDQGPTTSRHEGSMNSGRGYPVLEHWAASLKEGFNADESSGLEWAMDFERRKKEANQRQPSRPIPSQQSSSQASQGPHQNRFLAAKAALAAKRPFAIPETSQPGLSPHDSRAYLMRREHDQGTNSQSQENTKVRRIPTNRLPLERIPDGCDLHDVSLSLSANLPSIFHSFNIIAPHDSYVEFGKETVSFVDSGVDGLVPAWADRLQSIVARQYKQSGNHPCSVQLDLATVIAKHLQQHP